MIYQFLSNETCGFVWFSKVRNKRKHARQCSVISVSAELYFTKCGMVWCGAYQIKLQIFFDLRIIQKQEQDLTIWHDPVFNYMDFFISDAYARHKIRYPLFLESWSRSHNFSVVKKNCFCFKKKKKNVTLQILKFNSVSWIIELSPYCVMLILSLFPPQ